MQEAYWHIYKITSPSNNVYIGKTSGLKGRLQNYKRLNCKDQPRLYNSLLHYGFENHKIEIIDEFFSTQSYANGKEIMWIRSHMSNLTKWREFNGLNLTDGGDGCRGRKASAELSKKLSELRKGRVMSDQTKANISKSLKGLYTSSMKGKKHTDEAKLKMSIARKGKSVGKGRIASDETKAKMSKAKTGKPSPFKGVKKPPEYGKRVSEYHFKKPIVQYDMDGNFISEYESIKKAADVLFICRSNIEKVLHGRWKYTHKFIFKYKVNEL